MKRALLIGIDKYEHLGDVKGCVDDAKALVPLLARHWDGSSNFDCRVLRSDRDKVTRTEMILAIDKLLAPGADVAVFYFAGHGVGAPNDVSLASTDGDGVEPGVPLSLLLGKAQNSEVEEIAIFLDCCHAGGGGGSAMLGSSVALIRTGLAIVTAARGNEIAMPTEDGARGQFSVRLAEALDGNAADVTGIVSIAGVYAYLAECFGAWEQRPTFKANLEDSFELRRTKPLVAIDHLRELAGYFPSATDEYPLDPTYERKSPTRVPEKVAVYDLLSRCSYANLVEPVGADYLYYAAMDSKSCRLTPQGRHYCELVRKDLL